MKRLVFAEKPSVGRDIARILGARNSQKGFFEGNDYVISWGIGHLVNIALPQEQNPQWAKWSLNTLPMLPTEWKLVILPNSQNQFEIVKTLMNRNDINEIINAADAGREGELIFRWVYGMSGCTKPVKRLWISSLTDDAIKDGFNSLKPGADYDNLARAAECRSRADWLVGMNFTRCYSKKYGSMLTIGRVQTPTLAMVVNRHIEISNFKPKDYWEISVDLGDFKAVWFDPSENQNPSRIQEKKIAEKIAQDLNDATFEICKVLTSMKNQPPPLLYDLTTLQREANSKFGFTAASTLSLAQALYEQKKVITYPRTDSRYLSQDIYKTVPQRLSALPSDYDSFSKALKAGNIPKPRRVFDDKKVSDHHAIIPTEKKVSDSSNWGKDEKKLYDLIAKRFLAAFYPDYEYLSTNITAVSGGNFVKASGSQEIAPGWKVLYSKTEPDQNKTEESSPEVEEQALPALKKGDRRKVVETNILDKKTKPPPEFSEASLLQAMETAGKMIEDEKIKQAMKDGGLGTPATRAEIIEKLIKVGYLVRDKKKIFPTPKANQLISFVEKRVASPELTGSWENRLSQMAKGKEIETNFMKDITGFISEIVNLVKFSDPEKATKITQACSLPVLGLCPACQKGGIIKGKRGFGCNRFKEGCSYVVWMEFLGKKLPQSAIDLLIAGKPTRLLKGFTFEDGTVVSGKIQMRSDKTGIELVQSSKSEKPKKK